MMYHKIFSTFKGMNMSIALKSSLRFPVIPLPLLKATIDLLSANATLNQFLKLYEDR